MRFRARDRQRKQPACQRVSKRSGREPAAKAARGPREGQRGRIIAAALVCLLPLAPGPSLPFGDRIPCASKLRRRVRFFLPAAPNQCCRTPTPA